MKIPIFKKKRSEKQSFSTELEVCALCGKETDIPISLTVDERKYYVSGVGQLCRECYKELTHERLWVDL